MLFRLEIAWPYDMLIEEARRLIAAGGGTITHQDVLDAVLDELPDDSDATFSWQNVPGQRIASTTEVLKLREELGLGFWLPGRRR